MNSSLVEPYYSVDHSSSQTLFMRCCHLGETQTGNYQREQFQLATTLPKQKLSPYTMALTQTDRNFCRVWGSYTRSVTSHGGIYLYYGALSTDQDPVIADNTQMHNKQKVPIYAKAGAELATSTQCLTACLTL